MAGATTGGAMAWLFASGHAVDVVLAVIAGEAAMLTRSRGWRPTDALLRLLPGALMLVALRGALTGEDWRWIALPLLLSFPIHLADLASTGPGRRRAPSRISSP